MSDNAWTLIRSGATDAALQQMMQAYSRDPNASHAMQLGVAYLWIEDYRAAWEHFSDINHRHPHRTDAFYGMAGVAQWCLNKPRDAVDEWRDGLKCEFVDVAGGVTLPLMLYFASVMDPSTYPQSEATKTLESRADDGRAEIWPGPLAAYVSGRLDESEIWRACDGDDESDTRLRIWLTGFYVALRQRHHGDGDFTRFAELMEKTAVITDDDFDPASPDYLTKLWHHEFYLARRICASR